MQYTCTCNFIDATLHNINAVYITITQTCMSCLDVREQLPKQYQNQDCIENCEGSYCFCPTTLLPTSVNLLPWNLAQTLILYHDLCLLNIFYVTIKCPTSRRPNFHQQLAVYPYTVYGYFYFPSASEPNCVHVVIDRHLITGQNDQSTLPAVQNLILYAR